MTVQSASADVPEDVGRGLLLSLIAFPIAIVISAVGSSFLTDLGFVTGFLVGVGVTILISLYRTGAGVAVVRRGTAPVVLLGILLTLLTVLAGVLGRAYGLFHAVNLRSGLEALNSPAYATVVVRQFRDFDNILPIVVGLGFGLIAIAAGTRGAQRRADQAAASAPVAGTAASTATTIAPGGAPQTDATPPVHPAGQTLLNGEPIDPNASS